MMIQVCSHGFKDGVTGGAQGAYGGGFLLNKAGGIQFYFLVPIRFARRSAR